jgi:hypothetical protein
VNIFIGTTVLFSLDRNDIESFLSARQKFYISKRNALQERERERERERSYCVGETFKEKHLDFNL